MVMLALTDESGQVKESYTYDAYGNVMLPKFQGLKLSHVAVDRLS